MLLITSLAHSLEIHKFTYASLPELTQPGHEYTLSNAKFAQSVSSSPAVQDLIKECEKDKVTTGRFTIADEKKWNVFMRLDVPLTLHRVLIAGSRDHKSYRGRGSG